MRRLLFSIVAVLLLACDRPDDVVRPPSFQIMGDLPTSVDHITFDPAAKKLLVDVCISRGIIEAAQQGGVPFAVVLQITLAEDENQVTLNPQPFPLADFKPTGPAIEAVYGGTFSVDWDGTFTEGGSYTTGDYLTATYSGKVVRELSNGREIVIGTETKGQVTVTVEGG